jgi:hypothetical protein
MTPREILAVWRKRTDDINDPPQWSNADGVGFLNDALREACERAKLLRETGADSALTNLDGVANQSVYVLDPLIFQVNSCLWNSTFMRQISREHLNDRRALRDTTIYGSYFHAFDFNGVQDWSTLTGTPKYFLFEGNTLTLVKVPTIAAAIRLDAYRYATPITLDDLGSEIEIPARYHLHLVDWMEHLSYDNVDADFGDPKRSKDKEDAFTAKFGPRPSADTQRTRIEHRTHQTRMNPDW